MLLLACPVLAPPRLLTPHLRHPPPGRTRGPPGPCCCCRGRFVSLPAGRLLGGCKALGVAAEVAGARHAGAHMCTLWGSQPASRR